MPPIAVPVNGSALNLALLSPPPSKLSPPSSPAAIRRAFSSRSRNGKSLMATPFAKVSKTRASSFQEGDGEVFETVGSEDTLDELNRLENKIHRIKKEGPDNGGSSFLVTLAIALGLAAIITVISVSIEQSTLGPSLGFKILAEESVSVASPPVGFSFKAFGYKVFLPEYAPGWIYFWLLMAAGCGLFISEEALNIWVGITLSRMLSLDGTWQSFAQSLSRNTPYILSTVLWVYWGVCISDMIPFYLGKLFTQSGASDDVCSKLGIGREKAVNISRAVQKYGNLIGFVERFSLGVRNPTAFLAGALGISPEYFFAGVCCGGLITLPLQLGIGFLLRERPLFALATVATVVGCWTIFPYAIAAFTALFLFLHRRSST